MSKKILVPRRAISLPSACAVCGGSPSGTYQIESQRAGAMLSLDVPMCAMHLGMAKARSAAERRVSTIGLAVGLLLGVVAAIAAVGLLSAKTVWSGVATALMTCGAVTLVLWLIAFFAVAPRFADADAKAARSAVRITRYYAGSETVELVCTNDRFAEMVAAANDTKAE